MAPIIEVSAVSSANADASNRTTVARTRPPALSISRLASRIGEPRALDTS